MASPWLPVPGWSQCQQRARALHSPMHLLLQEQLPTTLLMGMGHPWGTQPAGILMAVNVCSEQARSCWAQQGSLGSGLFWSICLPPDAWSCVGRASELMLELQLKTPWNIFRWVYFFAT